MKTTFSVRDSVEATVVKNTDNGDAIRITGHVRAECYGPDGKLKWMEEGPNVIATTGLDYILNTDLAAASNFVGLLGAGTPVAGWTMTEAGGSTGAVSDTNGDREIHAVREVGLDVADLEDAAGERRSVASGGAADGGCEGDGVGLDVHAGLRLGDAEGPMVWPLLLPRLDYVTVPVVGVMPEPGCFLGW